ncbi:MAG: FGGY family carbohydrate kinase, partial [Alloalcanivorax venustensis]
MSAFILAIDQGTTSSRAIVFDRDGVAVGQAQKEFRQHFPRDGWVEHDAQEIWNDCLALCRQALRNAQVEADQLAAIGITNQRETTVLWDRATGEPVARAIVWQDRRTADYCQRLKQEGHEDLVRERSGLLLDPYFSATKLAWLLEH